MCKISFFSALGFNVSEVFAQITQALWDLAFVETCLQILIGPFIF